MVGIGADIKDVLQELATPFTIHRPGEDAIVGETLDYEFYYDQSTEFVRQFCYSGDFQYDSQVVNGDLIFFDNKYFLLLNVRKTMFEQEAVAYSNFFIECSHSGRIMRDTRTRDPLTQAPIDVPLLLHDNINAVVVEGAPDVEDTPGMNLSHGRYTLYCQVYSDIKVGDKWYFDTADTTDFVKIVSIQKHRYPNVLVCKMDEDGR